VIGRKRDWFDQAFDELNRQIKEKKISGKELAEACGVSQATVSMFRNQRAGTFKLAHKLCRFVREYEGGKK